MCNVLYVSRSANFLRLNDKVFKEFILTQMEMTLEEEARMGQILGRLLDKKYYREIVNTVRVLKKEAFTTRSLFEPFVMKIGAENEEIRQIIS